VDIKDKDQLLDKLIEAVDIQEEKNTWAELWKQAMDELFLTMADEHIEHVVKGLQKISEDY